MELFEFGELDCDIYFSGSMRTFIPMSSAINSMLKSLELALDLTYQSWLYSKVNDSTAGGVYSEASIKLRDRILKEGRVLPNDIVDVSSFMDAFVDVNLMDECAKHLAERFSKTKPSKILTIATTGLVVAIRKLLSFPTCSFSPRTLLNCLPRTEYCGSCSSYGQVSSSSLGVCQKAAVCSYERHVRCCL